MNDQMNADLIAKSHLYDAAVKEFLANKKLLAQILKGCVEEFEDCDVNDIAEKYIDSIPQIDSVALLPGETNTIPLNAGDRITGMANEDSVDGEGRRTFDIKFTAVAPRSGELIRIIINVEAQQDFSPGYSELKRAIYYASRLISAQYGTEFKKSEFDNLKKVYTIWIFSDPAKEWRNTITRYKFTEEHVIGDARADKDEYDMISVVLIGLDPEGTHREKDLLKLLYTALIREQTADSLYQILRQDYNMQIDASLQKEVDNMCNLSVGLIRRGEVRGEARGVEKGITEGKIAMARTLFAEGIPLETIARSADVPVEVVERWLELT